MPPVGSKSTFGCIRQVWGGLVGWFVKLNASKKRRPRGASTRMLEACSGPSTWKSGLPACRAGKVEAGRRQPLALPGPCPACLGWEMVLLCLSCWGDEGELGFSPRQGCFGASVCPAFLLSPQFWGERIPPRPAMPLAVHHELLRSLCSALGKQRAGEKPEGPESNPAWVGRRGWGTNEDTPIPAGPMAVLPAAP